MATGAERTGDRVLGVATSGAIVPDLGGGLFVPPGLATRFRTSRSIQRLEAECIRRASAEDAALWGAIQLQPFGSLEPTLIRRRQGPGSMVDALFVPLTDAESDDAIIEALDALS